ALSGEGKLFTHNDEKGVVYQLDLMTGRIIKKFYLVMDIGKGKRCVKDDFEDIAIAGNRFFMVSSAGKLYEFREGNDREHVEAVVYETAVDALYEVEGLCYEPVQDELLLSWKKKSIKKNGKHAAEKNDFQTADYVPVFAFSLKTMSRYVLPKFMLDMKAIARAAGKRSFRPSGIACEPTRGTLFLISSRSRLIVEIDASDGEPLSSKPLPKKYHPQPEGIVFLPDNTLLISDEGRFHGTISVYKNKLKD
ncbi:MAG: hypothetical protein HGA46_10420, partial [Chlorobiaceae bacterium]|nr:hypothetical protein [Chlorobiaceae bacterium]